MRTVIFDFDGTLVDTFSIVFEGINKALVKYGYQPVVDSTLLRNKSLSQLIFEVLNWHSWWQFWKYYSIWRLGKELERFLEEKKDKILLFGGIKEVLERLSKNYRVAIITSNFERIVAYVLNKSKIKLNNKCSNNEDCIFSSSSILIKIFGKHKIIEGFLKKYSLRDDEIIYVGDEIRDIEACRKVGVKVIAVCWGCNSKESLEREKPDYLAERPSDLLSVPELSSNT